MTQRLNTDKPSSRTAGPKQEGLAPTLIPFIFWCDKVEQTQSLLPLDGHCVWEDTWWKRSWLCDRILLIAGKDVSCSLLKSLLRSGFQLLSGSARPNESATESSSLEVSLWPGQAWTRTQTFPGHSPLKLLCYSHTHRLMVGMCWDLGDEQECFPLLVWHTPQSPPPALVKKNVLKANSARHRGGDESVSQTWSKAAWVYSGGIKERLSAWSNLLSAWISKADTSCWTPMSFCLLLMSHSCRTKTKHMKIMIEKKRLHCSRVGVESEVKFVHIAQFRKSQFCLKGLNISAQYYDTCCP